MFNRTNRRAALLAAAAFLVASSPAHAAVISRGYTLTGTFGSGAVQAVTLNFVLDYTPGGDGTVRSYTSSTTNPAFNPGSVGVASFYEQPITPTDVFSVRIGGGDPSALAATNDFTASFVVNASGDPVGLPFTRRVADVAYRSANGTFEYTSAVVTSYAVDPPTVVPSVPEPSTWAMLLLGFGATSAAMRYRRRSLVLRFA